MVKCPKCGKEYSIRVLEIHRDICKGSEETEVKQAEQADDSGATRGEMMSILDAAGVEYKPNMRKSELKKLVDEIAKGVEEYIED